VVSEVLDPHTLSPEEELFRGELLVHGMQRERVLTVGHNNIYSWMWKLEPPRGDLLYWHFGVSFHNSDLAQTLLGQGRLDNVEVIAISYAQHALSSQEFIKLHMGYIQENFTSVKTTDLFEIFVRHTR